jgi:hypothetical protein
MKRSLALGSLLFAGLVASGADWTDAMTVNVASVAGTTAGIPRNAACCIEYTFESATQRIVALKFWYYKPPKPVLAIGEHVRIRLKRGWTSNVEVTSNDVPLQKLVLARSPYGPIPLKKIPLSPD